MLSVADCSLKLIPKVVHNPITIYILDEHIKTQLGQSSIVLGVEVSPGICLVNLKELNRFSSDNNSRILGNLALKFVGTRNSRAIQFAGVKFDAPSDIYCSTNWITGCKPEETQCSSQTKQRENAVHSALHVLVT